MAPSDRRPASSPVSNSTGLYDYDVVGYGISGDPAVTLFFAIVRDDNRGRFRCVHRYVEANSVRQLKSKDCSLECRRAQYCAVTELEYSRFHSCVETAAEALSGSTRAPSLPVTAAAAAVLLIALT